MTPKIDKARAFAEREHAAQRYGDLPYAAHLRAVAGIVHAVGGTETEIVAAYLHDIVEDTATTLPDIEREFGPEVAAIVDAVTNMPGKNRRERHEATYPRILAAGSSAILVKVADRYANVRASIEFDQPKLLRMYRGEQAEFRAAMMSGRGYDPRVIGMLAAIERLFEFGGAKLVRERRP